ncbi:MAG: AAA family ATPase [Bacteroidales bacterium]|nr:MAG: AAA family ATPase [Bacteroidales bacterium]
MLKKHLISLIINSHDYSPTKNQEELINVLADFVINKQEKNVIIVKGYAGTGKTTTISALVKAFRELRIKSVLLAPTGRAAKVLTSYSGKIAYTIHKKIYRQKSSKDGFGQFTLEKNMHTNTFFLVDEASMISNQAGEELLFGSGRLLDDLIKYVYSQPGCKLILIGDTAQLPPVGISISPALDEKKLEGHGIDPKYIELTEVIRQSENSGILLTATQIRKNITKALINYPKFRISGFNDIKSISGSDLIEEISSAYSRHGINETIIICRSNKRANKYNQGIRNQIFNYEREIVPGELLMVVKNNYYWTEGEDKIDFIANGDIIEVLRIGKYYELYGFRFVDVTIRLTDYNIELDTKLMLDTLSVESSALSNEDNKRLFYTIMEDYGDIKSKKKQYEKVRNNEYYNALQVKYAYAVTCHKAQGGQWKTVFVDQGYITGDMINIDYLRWLYTAFTRAVYELYLVNFPEEYFNGS